MEYPKSSPYARSIDRFMEQVVSQFAPPGPLPHDTIDPLLRVSDEVRMPPFLLWQNVAHVSLVQMRGGSKRPPIPAHHKSPAILNRSGPSLHCIALRLLMCDCCAASWSPGAFLLVCSTHSRVMPQQPDLAIDHTDGCAPLHSQSQGNAPLSVKFDEAASTQAANKVHASKVSNAAKSPAVFGKENTDPLGQSDSRQAVQWKDVMVGRDSMEVTQLTCECCGFWVYVRTNGNDGADHIQVRFQNRCPMMIFSEVSTRSHTRVDKHAACQQTCFLCSPGTNRRSREAVTKRS